jgi:hypothetical protein
MEKSMYSLDEAQKGVGGKPANQKEIQRVYRLIFYFCLVNFSRHKNKFLFFSSDRKSNS